MCLPFRVRRRIARLRENLWLVPLLFSIGGVLVQRAMVAIDQSGLELVQPFAQETAIQLLAAVISALVGFIGFILTIVTLAIQLTAGQLSFRLLPLWYRETALKTVLGLFSGTLTYSFTTLGRMRAGFVPALATLVAGGLGLLSIVAFLSFVSGFTRTIAPAGIGAKILRAAYDLMPRAYPEPYREDVATTDAEISEVLDTTGPASFVTHRGGAGCVLAAIDVEGLVDAAVAGDCAIVVPHPVGTFVPSRGRILEIHGAREPLPRRLQDCLALRLDPTFMDDPYFALRLLVDIALRSLGVGDPSTAVRMVDLIEDLIFQLSERDLRVVHRDASGRPRLVVTQRTWREYVTIGFMEISQATWTVDVRSLMVATHVRDTLARLAARVSPGRRREVEDAKRAAEDMIAENAPEGIMRLRE